MSRPSRIFIDSTLRDQVYALYPELCRIAEAADRLEECRHHRVVTEAAHVERGGPAGPYNRSLAAEEEAAKELRDALRLWRRTTAG